MKGVILERDYSDSLSPEQANAAVKAITLEVAADELKRIEDMAQMVLDREWAEHAGKGPISNKVETAFTQLHNELSLVQGKLAKRDALCAPLVKIFQESLDSSVMPTFSKGDVRHIIEALSASASAEPGEPSSDQLALQSANERIAQLKEQLKRYQHQFPGA